MKMRYIVGALTAVMVVGAGVTYAGSTTHRTPVEFYTVHTHGENGE